MHELTADNALDYLRVQGWVGPGTANVTPLSGGVSNVVLRVETPERVFVLKQSRPQLRTRAAWYSDISRVYREQEVMQALRPLLPAGVVPAVLFADRPNYVFAMEHAPPGARVWKELLLSGQVDPAAGERAGRILGTIHEATALNPALVEPFRDPSVFVQLRVDPFYRRIAERHPDLAPAVGALADRLLTTREALCHGDYSPKNLLAHAGGFTLVDYETAYFGDPAMDLGFCASHLILKAFARPHDRTRHLDLVRAFWRGYVAAATFRPAGELEARGIGHCGVCLLARVDGTSPVDYLPDEPTRAAVRRLGRCVLADGPVRWGDVLAVAEGETGRLAGLGG